MVASIYVSVLSVTSTMLIRRPCGLSAGPRLTAAAADFESHALLLGPVRFREKGWRHRAFTTSVPSTPHHHAAND